MKPALPGFIDGYGPVSPYSGDLQPCGPAHPTRVAGRLRRTASLRDAAETASLRDAAETASLRDAIETAGLRPGATLSFHHHLRNGDDVMRQVLQACFDMGLRDLHIAPSSLFPYHASLIPFLQNGTITRITTSYVNGPLADAIQNGDLATPLVLQTHGGRAWAIESGRLKIDAAFVAAPAVDKAGNLSGASGPQACGPLGYAMVDAEYADQVIAVSDFVADRLKRICISGRLVDQIVQVEQIGNAGQISSGTTARGVSRKGHKIAEMTAQLILVSGLLRDGFSFQTGAGGTSLAVAKALGPVMAEKGVKGSFAAGGITAPLVEMFRQGLFGRLWDVQAFDLQAVRSYFEDADHLAMSAAQYASPARDDTIAGKLDVMILGAAEVDLDFNVNVTQGGDGRIIGGSGGHADTAALARLPIVTTSLTAGGFAKIVKRLTCLTTPGQTIGAVVCEAGVAIHPSRPDLRRRARKAGLPVLAIEALERMARQDCRPKRVLSRDARIVAVCEYRDGSVVDVIRADR